MLVGSHGPWAAPSAATALPHIIGACLPVTQQSGRIWNQCKQKAGIHTEKGADCCGNTCSCMALYRNIVSVSRSSLRYSAFFIQAKKVFNISGAVRCFLFFVVRWKVRMTVNGVNCFFLRLTDKYLRKFLFFQLLVRVGFG